MNPTLMTFGPIRFQVFPLNFHEWDHNTAADFARKDIMDSSPRRENVGENDEEIVLRGRCFPYHRSPLGRGAKSALDHLEAVRREKSAHMLIRYDGGAVAAEPLGWFVLERFQRHHTLVGVSAVGRVITFDAMFFRVDIAVASAYYRTVERLTAGGTVAT